MADATSFCEKCNKTMSEDQFYTYRDGTKTELCKKCLTMHINVFDESTYIWLLEKMDVPYVPEEWNKIRNAAQEKDPKKVSATAIFGKQLSKMKLKQWKDYRWADSEAITAESREKIAQHKAERADFEAELEAKFKNGEINEAQYKTLMSTEKQMENEPRNYTQAMLIGENNMFNEQNFVQVDLPDPTAELTDDDKVYLAMKWGTDQTPKEWLSLEKFDNDMKASFDIQDADSESVLLILSKLNLKMNQALDGGDQDGFNKLSRTFDSLRKSAKFTAAQNKAAKNDCVDSIGEIVSICEKEGFIPRFATDIPQDKVDATLKDMNGYINTLVRNELGFGQQIENALKRLQIQAEMEAQETLDNEYELEDDDLEDFYDEIHEQEEKDKEVYKDLPDLLKQEEGIDE